MHVQTCELDMHIDMCTDMRIGTWIGMYMKVNIDMCTEPNR